VGVVIDGANGPSSVTGVTVIDGGLGVVFEVTSNGVLTTVSADGPGSVGGVIALSHAVSVSTVSATGSAVGMVVTGSNNVTLTGITASDPVLAVSVGAEVTGSAHVSVSSVTASNEAVGVFVDASQWTSVSGVTLTNMSVGVYSEHSAWTYISGVAATNSTLSSPWSDGAPLGLPAVAAIVTYEDSLDTISNVQVTTYPAALYDYYSYDLGVNHLNATSSTYGIILNDTYYGTFTNLGMFMDWVGVEMNTDAYSNVVTQSSFVDCVSYAIAIYYGYYNLIYENTFINNNGADANYNSAHIQSYSGYGNHNYFDAATIGDYVGNYWSDWHTYASNGQLAPYPIGDGNWDHYPLGGPEGTVAVWFYSYGLLSGVPWSVTLNGVVQSSSNDWMVFYVLPGSYPFTVGAVTGYTETPGSGTVTAAGTSTYEDLYYTAQYNVTVTAMGLPTGTTWTAIVGGVSSSSANATQTWHVASGTYSYQVNQVPGYIASPSSGSITVGNANYNLIVTFTAVTYAVTVTESGLTTSTSWSATVNGDTQATAGASVTFYLPNGTYAFKVANVSGYTMTGASGSVTVNGAPAGVAVAYTPKTTTSLVSTDTFNMWLAVAIAVAVIALVLGLLALFLRRRREDSTQPAQAWTPPASGATDASATPAAGGSGTWSEGPPAGGSPPS